MNTSAQAQVVSFDILAVEQKVDGFYGAACKQYPTYESLVLRAFCVAMESEYGSEDQGPKAAAAFAYAREEYGYLNPSERIEQDKINAGNGLCQHGLDHMTCPCGCFEHDDFEETEEDLDAYYSQGALEPMGDDEDFDEPTSHADEPGNSAQI